VLVAEISENPAGDYEIEIRVNFHTIHEIHIQRVSGDVGELCEYAVRKPAIPGVVRHHYDDGAVALAATVLGALAEQGYGAR